MAKKVYVLSIEKEEQSLKLIVDESIRFINAEAKGQMLVDSDQFAFVYIIEMDGEYTYIVLKEEYWPMLKEALDESLSAFLFNQSEELPLPMFNEELEYLIGNIKGNSNYGEAMVEKVETTF
ncbi:hypothetical protein ACFSO7_04330 [Bacillus sp. CGMCC 1.16607]|uniref:UPF0738 family protein n=1 Tax=Bacillus sp. CGMCC 1.16607 TaxID=3351842 RepID=UPI003628FD82